MLLAASFTATAAITTPPLRYCRCQPPRCVAGTYSSDDWDGASWREKKEEDAEKQDEYDRRWLRLKECDVLMPPIGMPCAGIVHFVGGAFVGTAPKQSYSAFLEDLSDGADVCIVATPVAGLTGLDHYAAANEVMLRWCSVASEVHSALDTRASLLTKASGGGLPSCAAASLPVIGVGHSLGAKLLILLGSDPNLSDLVGPRCANALVAYNSYSAKQSVPMLEQAVAAASAAQASGLGSAVAPGVAGLSGVGESLSASASQGLRALGKTVGDSNVAGSIDQSVDALANGLGGLLGNMGVGMGGGAKAGGIGGGSAETLASGLNQAAQVLNDLGGGLGEAGRRASRRLDGVDELADDEFTPSPEDTAELVLTKYAVGRNLLVRFVDDTIDQSQSLAQLFKRRFTDDVTGIGGRIDFKRTDGTHVTPNTPRVSAYLDNIDIGMAEQLGVADAARSLASTEFEREAASELIADFARRELKRAADA